MTGVMYDPQADPLDVTELPRDLGCMAQPGSL